MNLIQARAIIGLPRYQDALSAAVKAKAVQRALQLSFQNATQGKFCGPMRTTIRQDSRKTMFVSPNYQVFAKALDANRLALTQLFGLQDRVPIVS